MRDEPARNGRSTHSGHKSFAQLTPNLQMEEPDKTVYLKGGMSTKTVLKIGPNVHRTKASNYPFIHSVLLHLATFDFPFSPRFLGIDDEGREVLSFIPGEVPREIPLTLPQKVEAIKVLRMLHDVLSSFENKGEYETICHHDVAPWNVIVNNKKIVGIIDFDEAAPGNRIDDVAYFIWTFLELGNSLVPDNDQIAGIAALADAYGLAGKEHLVPAIIHQQTRIREFRTHITLQGTNAELVEFSQKALIQINKSIDWVHSNRSRIEQAL
ncbi:MAG: aminoglycoside phosphotransferase family protein [Bacteroidota bacterium]